MAHQTMNFNGWRACCLAALLLTVGGCANNESAGGPPHLGLSCVDDSAHCIAQREKAFDSLVGDKSRAWVKQPATPDAYASGVRLFAFSKKRHELSCDELAAGKREADAGPGVLRGSAGHFTSAQVSRGVMLAGEVGRDLGREMDKRCRRT